MVSQNVSLYKILHVLNCLHTETCSAILWPITQHVLCAIHVLVNVVTIKCWHIYPRRSGSPYFSAYLHLPTLRPVASKRRQKFMKVRLVWSKIWRHVCRRDSGKRSKCRCGVYELMSRRHTTLKWIRLIRAWNPWLITRSMCCLPFFNSVKMHFNAFLMWYAFIVIVAR